MKVWVHFSGVVAVNIPDIDPEDDEAFCEAIGEAWGNLPHEDVSSAASMDQWHLEPTDE